MITLIVFVVIPLIIILVIALLMVEPSMGIDALSAFVLAGSMFWAICKRT